MGLSISEKNKGNMLFIDQVDNRIQEKHLLNHSFYKAWSAGELSVETIR